MSCLRDYLPNETMIVTEASSTRGALWSFAVTADDGTTIVQDNGTRFAAPLVSGAAGLLISFDSSLTAARVKQLLDAAVTMSGQNAVSARR